MSCIEIILIKYLEKILYIQCDQTIHHTPSPLSTFRFVSVEEKKRLGTIKDNEVMVQRKKDTLINNTMQTVTIPFRIVDQPLKLQPNEWQVVLRCLIIIGWFLHTHAFRHEIDTHYYTNKCIVLPIPFFNLSCLKYTLFGSVRQQFFTFIP